MKIDEIATKADILALKQEIAELKRLVKEKEMLPTGYVSRTQALSMLNVSRTTLWQLSVNRRLIGYTGKGVNAQYCFADIKQYLSSKHIKATAIDARIGL